MNPLYVRALGGLNSKQCKFIGKIYNLFIGVLLFGAPQNIKIANFNVLKYNSLLDVSFIPTKLVILYDTS